MFFFGKCWCIVVVLTTSIQCDAFSHVFACEAHSQTSWLFMNGNKLFKPIYNYCNDVQMFKIHPVFAYVVGDAHSSFGVCVCVRLEKSFYIKYQVFNNVDTFLWCVQNTMSAQCSFIHWNLCIRMYVSHIAAQPDKPHTPWIWTEYAYFTTKVKRTHFCKIWPFLSHVCCFDILCISRCVASHLFIHTYMHIYILSTWKQHARFIANSYCVCVFFFSLCVFISNWFAV